MEQTPAASSKVRMVCSFPKIEALPSCLRFAFFVSRNPADRLVSHDVYQEVDSGRSSAGWIKGF
jgi:hypothetical protein